MAGKLNNLPQLLPGHLQQNTLHLNKTRGVKGHNETQEPKPSVLEEDPACPGPSWDCSSRVMESAVLE